MSQGESKFLFLIFLPFAEKDDDGAKEKKKVDEDSKDSTSVSALDGSDAKDPSLEKTTDGKQPQGDNDDPNSQIDISSSTLVPHRELSTKSESLQRESPLPPTEDLLANASVATLSAPNNALEKDEVEPRSRDRSASPAANGPLVLAQGTELRTPSPKRAAEALEGIFIPPTEVELQKIKEDNVKKDETDVAPSRLSRAYEKQPDAPTSSTLNDATTDVIKDENANENQTKEEEDRIGNEDTIVTASELTTFLDVTKKKESPVDELKKVLASVGVVKAHWSTTNNGYHQVTFIDEGGQRCEEILDQILSSSIGVDPKSSVSVMPVTMHFQLRPDSPVMTPTLDTVPEEATVASSSPGKGMLTNFVKSVKSRLIVMQVVEGVRANARLTFDYVMLVLLASCLAACGLVEDSSVILVASMLVSPLMGPILAGVFGHAISNGKLRNLGIKSELVGLVICIFIGFLLGLFFSVLGIEGVYDTWPTDEMKSRGLTRSLWMGILIAVPSGAAVALSVLGGNVGSLVGVAISASLLPPMVNGGILLGIALAETDHCSVDGTCHDSSVVLTTPNPTDTLNSTTISPNDTLTSSSTSIASAYKAAAPDGARHLICDWGSNQYKPVYSCALPQEAALLGVTSIALTILNIFCIFVMAIVVFKIKEVVPKAALSTAAKTFWQKDIKTYRNYYKTVKPGTDEFRDMMSQWRETKRNMDGGKDDDDDDHDFEDASDESQLYNLVAQMKAHPHVQEISNRAPRVPRVQTVFDDFNLKSLFSPSSPSEDSFDFGDENRDDDDDDELFLTVRDPDVGGKLIRCTSRDDAVVSTITSNARVDLMTPPATVHASGTPTHTHQVVRIKINPDGSHQRVHQPHLHNQHRKFERQTSHPRFRNFQVTQPTIFQLKTPNPDAIKAKRRSKKVELVEPQSASSTSSSRFRVNPVRLFRRGSSSSSSSRPGGGNHGHSHHHRNRKSRSPTEDSKLV